MNECITNAFYIYLAVIIAIYITQPPLLFYHKEKKCLFKKFGCGKNKTIFSIHIVSVFLSIITYFMTHFLLKLEN
jgi:hypothetical protein